MKRLIRKAEIDPERLSQEGKQRLYSNQNPGQFFNKSGLSPLEDIIVEYTAGGVEFSSQEEAEIKSLIQEAPTNSSPLYRVEEASNEMMSLKVGDTFSRNIQSYSKSESFVNSVANGSHDVPVDNPVIIKIVGNNKSLDIQGYSYFTEQRESLTYGNFIVKNIKDENNVRIIEVEQA